MSKGRGIRTQVWGDILIVPQYTLFADVSKGRRPDFTRAAKPEPALPLYEAFVEAMTSRLVTPAADLRNPVEMRVIGLSDRFHPLHEARKLLELRPLVVHRLERTVDIDRFPHSRHTGSFHRGRRNPYPASRAVKPALRATADP